MHNGFLKRQRDERIAGRKSIEHAPLVQSQDILVHCFASGVKEFHKVLEQTQALYAAVGDFANGISEMISSKIKEGIFDGPDVQKSSATRILEDPFVL